MNKTKSLLTPTKNVDACGFKSNVSILSTHQKQYLIKQLSDERDDLVRKMNELNLRYEEYVSSMNEERDRIIRTNKTHVRLLTAKLLF
jgi:tRNA(Phe) wybutosine-synthesizing methylase Tyw3